MEHFILAWLVSIGALYLSAALVKEITIKGFAAAALAALALEICNLLVPWLLHFLSPSFHALPVDVIRFLAFALLFWGVGCVVPGFKVAGPGGAVVGALVLMLMLVLLHWLFGYLPHFHMTM